MRRLPLVLAAVALGMAGAAALTGAFGLAPRSETGWVTEIEDRSLTQVDAFTLRTEDGRAIVFRVGRLDLDDGAFPAGHLREHRALNQPVLVRYREENGERVAFRLEDVVSSSPGSPASS